MKGNHKACEDTKKYYWRVIKVMFQDNTQIHKPFNEMLEIYKNETRAMQAVMYPSMVCYRDLLELTDEHLDLLKHNTKQSKDEPKQHPIISDEQFDRMYNAMLSNDDYAKKIMLAVLMLTGVRRSEVRELVENYVKYRSSVVYVKCKGNKDRSLYLHPELVKLLDEAIETGKIEQIVKKISPNTVYTCAREALKTAGIDGACHDFRRHFAQNLNKRGVRTSMVKKLMGHDNVNTTYIYIHDTEEDLHQAINNQLKPVPPVTSKDYVELINKYDRIKKQLEVSQKSVNELVSEVKRINNEKSEMGRNLVEMRKMLKRTRENHLDYKAKQKEIIVYY